LPGQQWLGFFDHMLRVLLVDDDASLLDSATMALVNEGFDVLATRNGTDALHQVNDGFQPTVLVAGTRAMDIMGAELADAIRDVSPSVAVVFLTESLIDIRDLTQQPRTAVVVKPFDAVDLVCAVHVMARTPSGEVPPSSHGPGSEIHPDDDSEGSNPSITFGEFASPWIAAIIMVLVAWLVIRFLSR
jgi:DNA-binding response OmpR family regulator